jgi:hypothetical protein
MNTNIFINFDGDISEPEIQISGTWYSLSEFGCYLNQLDSSQNITLPVSQNEFYPEVIKHLNVCLEKDGNGLLTVTMHDQTLNVAGNTVAINKLAESLTNFFDEDSEIQEHFQLDYYEGNDVLNETSCTLIFICDR